MRLGGKTKNRKVGKTKKRENKIHVRAEGRQNKRAPRQADWSEPVWRPPSPTGGQINQRDDQVNPVSTARKKPIGMTRQLPIAPSKATGDVPGPALGLSPAATHGHVSAPPCFGGVGFFSSASASALFFFICSR